MLGLGEQHARQVEVGAVARGGERRLGRVRARARARARVRVVRVRARVRVRVRVS